MSLQSHNGFDYIINGHLAGPASPMLLLHKTGGDERELLGFADQVAPDRPLIAVRGPVVEDGKHRFFRRISAGVFDEEDLRRRTHDLAELLKVIAQRHGSHSPVALGLSNGANIAAALLLLHPESLSGAALLRPACPFADLPDASLADKPVLVVAGAGDTTVPARETDRLVAHLAANGAVVTSKTIDAGHRMTDGDAPAVQAWLHLHASQSRKAI